MNGGIFKGWFREFATIVFTQTVQAFLLAIVLVIIINSMSGSTDDSTMQAGGFLAIVALASFSKIELLIKNIFGVTSGAVDTSLAGQRGFSTMTALGLAGARRLSDNAAKVTGGIKTIRAGKKGMKEESHADLQALNKGIDEKYKSTNNETLSGGSNENLSGASDKGYALTLVNDEGLKQSIDNLTRAVNNSNKGLSGGSGGPTSYKDMVKQGKRSLMRGTLENVGAAVGAATGAVSALATGEDVIGAMGAGAGAGDAVGSATASVTYGTIDAGKAIGGDVKSFARGETKWQTDAEIRRRMERSGVDENTKAEYEKRIKDRENWIGNKATSNAFVQNRTHKKVVNQELKEKGWEREKRKKAISNMDKRIDLGKY